MTSMIVDNSYQSDARFLGDAARMVASNSLVWTRRIEAPVEQVWQMVSTVEGLNTFWIAPVRSLQLEPGGLFVHHWPNRVREVRARELIDFGGMRFELAAHGEATGFAFLDTWRSDAKPAVPDASDRVDAVQPGGVGTPWSGVAAGWHCMVDDLVAACGGAKRERSFEQLSALYAGYLQDLYRWHALAPARNPARPAG